MVLPVLLRVVVPAVCLAADPCYVSALSTSTSVLSCTPPSHWSACVAVCAMQYNYIDNFPLSFLKNSSVPTYQSLSYTGAGNNNPQNGAVRCGCEVCPGMTCNLARSGPARGPLTSDLRKPYNLAVNAQLEGCGGTSGSCMTINGEKCCIAVASYEYYSTQPCDNTCENYASTITFNNPLSRLWMNISYPLPQ